MGVGGPVGAVVATRAAVIPSVTGVDLGCGMMAVRTTLLVDHLENMRPAIRARLEDSIPVGGPGVKGSWPSVPRAVELAYEREFEDGYVRILAQHPKIAGRGHPASQLGTLGTGNHFIEVCADETGHIWLMLHSGSRGVGNRIGTYFIEQAKEQALQRDRSVKVDLDLAWLDEGSDLFADYVRALGWAQQYARRNRELMMAQTVATLESVLGREVPTTGLIVNVHHNYVESRPDHLYLTRKGAVSARLNEWGIIPGSMGTKSYIVRGLGNAESFESCSHGAGRRMSRGMAKRTFTLDDLATQTAGVECRKDAGVLDETPGAYKDLDRVMAAQSDLVRIEYTLRALVSVKG